MFVMLEVNYPRLQVQSQLALFALLGLGIVFLHMPLKKGLSEGSLLRRLDWLLFAASVVCFGYIIVQTEPLFESLWLGDSALGNRAGDEVSLDYAAGFVGLVLVFEATRRTVGLALPLLTVIFLIYAKMGRDLPDWLVPHRGFSWSRIASQTFLHSQGVFGIALSVMFKYVFPFVLFGAFLEATGATGFVIHLTRRLFRRSAGGPAKVAVLSSGLMGSLSGSAVANTATTGTFTIPMMRSSGFEPHLAAGVVAGASAGGALMPPIMGAGAYMMLEIIPDVTYLQIIKAALVPAVLYYVALLLVVHLHARKTGAVGGDAEAEALPLSVMQGVIFFMAILSLIGFLISGFTPFRSVTLSLALMLLIAPWAKVTRLGPGKMLEVLVRAAKTGTPLIAAASCVGIILGVVTLTGIGSRLPSLILPLAQDNLLAALFLLMVSTIILGMGLPSAVCYLLMATFVGTLLSDLGLVPLAAHLFIFYFGMMSMVTPPVALAAYTAAAIAKADVMRTCFAAFRFSLVGFVLPYAFVLDPSLLLMPLEGGHGWDPVVTIFFVLLGILFLTVSLVGYCFNRVSVISRAVLFVFAMVLVLLPWGDVTRLGITLFERGLVINLVISLLGGGLLYLNAKKASQTVHGKFPEGVTGSPATGEGFNP
ncbi:MAG: TRAP transporter fused permease subunit [Planctomycetes bacterium]|nr:TRAP transporter fused permease subunit [Planctomycetota bacterium]